MNRPPTFSVATITSRGQTEVTPSARVSVIIPVYQGKRYVAGAIRSALRQTHLNMEVLVVDDGSTDGTWPLLRSIQDNRVRVFRQQNRGASAARNLGLEKATGEYIAFLDADDRWFPNKIERELRVLEGQNSPIGIAYSWYYAVDDDGVLLHRSPALTYSGNVFDDLLKGSVFIIPSASLFHRAIFESLGGFETKRRHHEDCALFLRACYAYPAYPTCSYSVIYRQSMSGKGRSVLQDYETAVAAVTSIADGLRDILSATEADRVLDSQRRELYFRFLMYGFNASATRLLRDIPIASLPGGAKGWLGWIFAKTKLNLILPCRKVVQGFYRLCGQSNWRHVLQIYGLMAREEFTEWNGG